jgi:hypothetical protein
MVVSVVVIAFAMKSAARGVYSLHSDTLKGTMKFYLKRAFDKTGRVPDFYEKLQRKCVRALGKVIYLELIYLFY